MDEKNKLLSDKVLNKVLKVLGIVLLFLAVLFMASQFGAIWTKISGAIGSVLVPVSLAWLISLVIYPIIKLLERRGVGPRGFSVTVVYIGSAVIIGLMFYYITPFVINQVAEFFEVGGDYDAISNYFKGDFIGDKIRKALEKRFS